ncbi:Pr6Pr family membrane protein [Spiroplasma endosymbiont of Othius punctulatus]|uniref:Pr6Pr family membrane protein n=1 Tax=Spiroplasma endosymbiont of Othius punctulatus TaxID=3066289 RepID=UPI0030D38E11
MNKIITNNNGLPDVANDIFKNKKNIIDFVKSWKFWFKAIITMLIIFFVLYDIIDHCINIPKHDVYQQFIYENKNGEQLVDYFRIVFWDLSYFTIQSNLLMAAWLIYAAIYNFNEHEKKLTSTNASLFVIIYLTTTALIYNGILFPISIGNGEYKEWTTFYWIRNEFLHTVGPILSVIYVLLFLKVKEVKQTKLFFKEDSWKSLYYPIGYGVFSFAKQGVMALEGFTYENTAQYPFLDMKNSWWLFIVAALAIATIGVTLSTLYNFIISKRIGRTEHGTN